MRIKRVIYDKRVFVLICLFGCALFSIYYFFMSRGLILHSDDAYQGPYWYHMLTSGNEKIYRLNLSFGTFISLLSYFFTGISLNTPYITYAIMYSLLIWISICLSVPYGKKVRYATIPIFAYIMGCVNYQGVLIFRAHMDIIILAYCAFICFEYLKFLESPRKQKLLLIAFSFSLIIGRLAIDYLFLIIAFVPIIIVEAVRYLKEKDRKSIYIIAAVIMSYLIACGIEKIKGIVFTVMERPMGEHTNTVIFGNFDTLEHNFHNLVYGVLHMFDAYFLDQNMLQLKTVFWFINSCILLLGIVLVCKSLYSFYKYIRFNTVCDIISVILSIGIIGIVLSFLLTQVATDYTCWRYAICIFSGVAVLIVRNLYMVDFKMFASNMICIFMILLIPFSIQPIPESKAVDERDKLAIFLESEGLISGFCDLWQASYIDAASRGALHMIPLNYSSKGYYQWGTRFENWHMDNFNFIIEDTTMPIRQFTYSNIVAEFGEPQYNLVCDKYIIYVYDYDLSTKIVWEDNLSDAQYVLEQAKNHAKTSMQFINTTHNDVGDYFLHQNSQIRGPLISLKPGTYELRVVGEKLNDAEIDFPFLDDNITYDTVKENDSCVMIRFCVQNEIYYNRLFTITNSKEDIITYYYYGLDID